jgi:gliding motility-associated protein GldL
MAGKKKFKLNWLHLCISWGASVVIIGAMLKILHKHGGDTMIEAGLITEACLFFITGFFAPDEDLPWERVYPELNDDFAGELPKSSAKGIGGGGPVQATAALDKMLADAKIGPELISSLGDGLRTFGDRVASISKVADAGMATNEFASSIKAASASYQGLSVVRKSFGQFKRDG